MPNEKNTAGKDDFWDLSALVPPRPKAPQSAPAQGQPKPRPRNAGRDTEAVDVTAEPKAPQKTALSDELFKEHFVPPHTAGEAASPAPLYAYAPQNALIREVRVYPWRTQYDYYEHFRQCALRLHASEGKECPAADFFSYMPQYTQLNAAQLNYYLWWRTNFRRGVCLPVSYPYLLLYLYELINLDEAIPSAEGQALMVRLWLSYREQHPRLDPLVREWLCDYSLLHRLPAPALPQRLYRDLLSGCSIKEFYVPPEGDALIAAILLFCNNYDYTKSKFFTPDTAADYHRVLRGAIGAALRVLRERDGSALTGESGVSTVSRSTFIGAICSYRLRRRVEVDYTSFSHTHELRYIMTDVLKYAENALRASRGVKARLTVYALDKELREALDGYLREALPQKAKQGSRQEEVPEYERRYDVPHTAPSLARAAEIEAESWQTTKRLVEAFGADDGEREEAPVPTPAPAVPTSASVPDTPSNGSVFAGENPAADEAKSPFAAALGDLCDFVRLCDACNAKAQRQFALSRGTMPDAVADKINTVAGDMLGDILLTEDENGAFAVIDDYREFLIEQGVL